MIKAVVFDVDDTLYDLSTPFKEACREVFPDDTTLDLEGAFLASRRYSDAVYASSLSGKISMEEMYVYRFENAFRDYGKKIDAQMALMFQAVYEQKQQKIQMTESMKKLLDHLKEKVKLGIITNGPAQHQWDKVNALGVKKWIPEEHIFISGDLGVAKPDVEIFDAALQKLQLQKEEVCYVGDSFENDMVGAKNAGWKAIWYNHRRHKVAENVEPDYVVKNEEELIRLLESSRLYNSTKIKNTKGCMP